MVCSDTIIICNLEYVVLGESMIYRTTSLYEDGEEILIPSSRSGRPGGGWGGDYMYVRCFGNRLQKCLLRCIIIHNSVCSTVFFEGPVSCVEPCVLSWTAVLCYSYYAFILRTYIFVSDTVRYKITAASYNSSTCSAFERFLTALL